MRISYRDPIAASMLRLSMKNLVFNDVIKRNIKETEGNFPRRRFNPYNKMRSSMPEYNINYNAFNSFKSGYMPIIIIRGCFFKS
jgi:hypothetical protein